MLERKKTFSIWNESRWRREIASLSSPVSQVTAFAIIFPMKRRSNESFSPSWSSYTGSETRLFFSFSLFISQHPTANQCTHHSFQDVDAERKQKSLYGTCGLFSYILVSCHFSNKTFLVEKQVPWYNTGCMAYSSLGTIIHHFTICHYWTRAVLSRLGLSQHSCVRRNIAFLTNTDWSMPAHWRIDQSCACLWSTK